MFFNRRHLLALGGCFVVAKSAGATGERVLYASEFGAGGGDATSALQAALNEAGRVAPSRVIATDRRYLTDTLVVPAGVRFDFDIKMRSPPRRGREANALLVHPGCMLVGRIEGNGVSREGVIERGVYPAVESCHDVRLDVEVVSVTVAVQAHREDVRKPPRRWSGRIVARDITGAIGDSNGYGLLGTLCDSALEMTTTNVPRHALYLIAGASNNDIRLTDRGGRYAPVDIASFPSQPACIGNRIVASVRDHRGNYPGLPTVGAVVIGACRGNWLEIDVADSARLHSAVRLLAAGPEAYPRDNVISVRFEGSISGNGVAEINSGTGNQVSVSGRGTGFGDPSAVVYVGSNDRIIPRTSARIAATVEAIDFVCTAGFRYAVIAAADYGAVDIGTARIRTRGVTEAMIRTARATQVIGTP